MSVDHVLIALSPIPLREYRRVSGEAEYRGVFIRRGDRYIRLQENAPGTSNRRNNIAAIALPESWVGVEL